MVVSIGPAGAETVLGWHHAEGDAAWRDLEVVSTTIRDDSSPLRVASPLPTRRRVGAVLWSHQPIGTPRFTVTVGEPTLRSAIVELDGHDGRSDPASGEELPTLRWRRPLGEDHQRVLELSVRDGSHNGHQAYDQLVVAGGEPSVVTAGAWFRLDASALLDQPPHPGSVWCRLLDLHPQLGSIRLYVGPLEPVVVTPHGALDILARLEPWPGRPDEVLLARGWVDPTFGITPDTYLTQAERAFAYVDRAATALSSKWPVDLLLVGDPAVAGYRRGATIVDPAQWGYSPGAALAARDGLERLGGLVGATVRRWSSLVDRDHDLLLVISTQELRPVHSEVRLRRWLAKHGLESGADGPLRVTCTGASVRLEVVNSPGTTANAERLLRRAAHCLADLEVDGQPVVLAAQRGPTPLTLRVQLEAGFTSSCSRSEPVVVAAWRTAARSPAGRGVVLARGQGPPPKLATTSQLWRVLAGHPRHQN